ncbi:MAG: zinc-ribbon and DUF3426 domain-containing protein [Burkholderiales bacterium]
MNVLVTRCPACGTAFRAAPAQLSARSGMVRCGKCRAVFDGVAHLEDEPDSARLANEPSPQLGLFEGDSKPPAAAVARATAPDADDEPLPEFLEDEPPRPRYAVAWGLAALIALGALLGQLGYQYRSDIATLAPGLRPALEEGCRFLGCEVHLRRRPELLSIESSDLQADPARASHIVLNVVIRNRAAYLQELPALELTLTDDEERAVVRRVLRPRDYLRGPAFASQAGGLAPGAEAVLRVHFDTAGLRATGYRLYLFYPA